MNGYFILLVALAISAVAAYYSIVGLATLFAAAVIPVIIMGATLEVAKLVTASWLYTNWKNIPFLLKTYFTIAVFILMFITSMGIFGFLSKAHIEQTGNTAQLTARLDQIPSEISRIDNSIQKIEQSIETISNKETQSFDTVQQQINQEQLNIDKVYARIQPDVDRLQAIINDARTRKGELTNQVNLIETYVANNQIKELQTLVGVNPDGSFGPATQAAVENFKVKITLYNGLELNGNTTFVAGGGISMNYLYLKVTEEDYNRIKEENYNPSEVKMMNLDKESNKFYIYIFWSITVKYNK